MTCQSKFVLLSVFGQIDTPCLKHWAKPFLKNAKTSFAVDVRRSKTSLLKFTILRRNLLSFETAQLYEKKPPVLRQEKNQFWVLYHREYRCFAEVRYVLYLLGPLIFV